ncbi:MAG: N-acetyl-gamma-glutamyl-phosphate reductase [Acidimicrobiales bacterium]
MVSVGVFGASGFAGAELLRLLAGHPELEVALVTGDTHARTPVAELYPNLAGFYGELVYQPSQPELAEGLDVAYLAMPHGVSQTVVPELLGRVKHVVDLAADFRLSDPALYPEWYGESHVVPDLLSEFAYGIPELWRSDIVAARNVAAPGCYPTAAILPLAPLAAAGLIEPTGIVVDAASGVSGGGRGKFPFCGTDEDFSAYGLLHHRHTPEIEQALTRASAKPSQVIFTPHLAPMNRGILATCYARPASSTSTDELLACLHAAYDSEPFVVVSTASPSTKATMGANTAHLTVRYDTRTGWVLALCAIDNLVKGTSGQAIQCTNLILGLPETMGLPIVGLNP